jgi:hypothetical protein
VVMNPSRKGHLGSPDVGNSLFQTNPRDPKGLQNAGMGQELHSNGITSSRVGGQFFLTHFRSSQPIGKSGRLPIETSYHGVSSGRCEKCLQMPSTLADRMIN